MRPELVAFALVVTANMAPWAVGRVMGTHGAMPLDFGRSLADGTRLLGSHKTWRGLFAATVASGGTAQLLQLDFLIGAAFGSLATVGDAASSFVKRRLRMVPGAEAPGLDQLPESLLPLLSLAAPLGITWRDAIAVSLVFSLLDVVATKLRR